MDFYRIVRLNKEHMLNLHAANNPVFSYVILVQPATYLWFEPELSHMDHEWMAVCVHTEVLQP